MQPGTQQRCLFCWKVYFGSQDGGGEIWVHIYKYIWSLFLAQPSELIFGNKVKGLLEINLPNIIIIFWYYESFQRKVLYNNIIWGLGKATQ